MSSFQFNIHQKVCSGAVNIEKGKTVILSPEIYFPTVGLVVFMEMNGKTSFHNLEHGQPLSLVFNESSGSIGVFGLLEPKFPHPAMGAKSQDLYFGRGAGKDFKEKEAALLQLTGQATAHETTSNVKEGEEIHGFDYSMFYSNILPCGLNSVFESLQVPDVHSVLINPYAKGEWMVESGVVIQVNIQPNNDLLTAYIATLIDEDHKDANYFVNLDSGVCWLSAFIIPELTHNSDGTVDIVFQIGDPQKDGTIKLQTV